MAKEIEIKFLNIDHDDMRAKLKALGAKLKSPRTLYKRINLDFKDDLLHKLGSWVRLRDEGDKITLTHKIHSKSKKDQLKIEEFEITVNSFDHAVSFLESINMKVKTYQENYRENWSLKTQSGLVEVALDQWPHVRPHIEIELESGDEKSLEEACQMLNLNFTQAINDDICPVYMAEYDISERSQLYDLEGGFRFNSPIKLNRKLT